MPGSFYTSHQSQNPQRTGGLIIWHTLVSLCCIGLLCGPLTTNATQIADADGVITVTYAPAPQTLEWQTPTPTPWGDPTAASGGIFRLSIQGKPSTLRRFGPETPSELSQLLADLQLPLLARHPQTGMPTPMLASQWAVADHRITYQLTPAALWSDGTPITSGDIAFTLQFLSDPANKTPWQAHSLRACIRGIEIHDQQRFSLITTAPVTKQTLLQISDLRATAQHFYQPNLQWPRQYDWRPEPTSGPYRITEVIPSERLIINRTTPWWGDQLPQFANRFNASQIQLRFTKSLQDSYQLLQRGDLDALALNSQQNWDSPVVTQLLSQRPITRYQHYFQGAQPTSALLINKQHLQLIVKKTILTLIHTGSLSSPFLQQQLDVFKTQGYQINDLPLSQGELLEQLKTRTFDLAWVTLDGLNDTTVAEYIAWLTEKSTGASNIELKQDKNQQGVSQYLAWQWARLPAWLGTRYSNDLFNPFDPVTGGLFWIDQRLKATALARATKFTPNQTLTSDAYRAKSQTIKPVGPVSANFK
ncbi:ABC transporter substrate-binding protein [Oceanobacter antarcticus]|uniref:ABC transporter substrate-binding protein n=1 Tax=Oceanobacter antarcticus TaxID=3133425 RepID=A0ABW8NHV4_9GAMM